jgi:lipoate-protein ligase A
MKYIDLTLPSPAENLAADEALLDLCEDGGVDGVLRFWEPQQLFVVLGYANRAATEADLPACQAAQVGVFRRFSGGGTVLQGPGCLNYSVILRIPESAEPNSPLLGITTTNHYILQKHRDTLQPLLRTPVEIQGHTDLTIPLPPSFSPTGGEGGREGKLKFSGNSQRRKRHSVIFHGTFLLNFDLGLIEKFLRMPSQQPAYRGGRPHRDFLTNLNLAADAIKQSLRRAWEAHEPLADFPTDAIAHLTSTKYSTDDWNLKL